MIQSALITTAYLFYALAGALVFWRKGNWYALLPLSAFIMGGYVFLEALNFTSLLSKGVLITALLSLEVVFAKYSFLKPKVRQRKRGEDVA